MLAPYSCMVQLMQNVVAGIAGKVMQLLRYIAIAAFFAAEQWYKARAEVPGS